MTYSESAVSELSTTRFLTQLRQLGVRVWLDGEKLRYQAAKGVMTAELLAELSSRKAEVVTLIQQAKQSNLPDTAAQLTISPASRSQPIPLSVAQQRLWFLEQLHEASSAYNIVGAFVFEGHLDVQALQDSLTEIVRRHESLRTTFALAGDQAAQIVQPAEVVPLPCHDLSHLPKEARWAEARRLATAEASLPFDIADDLLLRGQLVKTTADQHIFLLTFHHLVTDGVSVGIFNHELATLYSAFVAGTSAELPHLPVQYADYAASQHKWMTAGAFTDLVGYWQKQLAGAPELLQLPFDHPRPAVQTFNGAVCASTITNDVVAQLRELARAEGTTLYMVVQAAFSAFLGRYCNQQDVLTGLSVANRPNEQLADLIGFFVNTLVVRVDLSARPTFRQLLRQTRATVLDAFEHQALPFEKLVEAVRPERDMSYAPLVQAMMSWLDGDATLPQLPGLTITPFESDFVPARLDLLLEVYEAGDWLKLMWLYNTDLFDIKTVERLGLNFELFLQAIVSDPDRSVHTLPLMSDAEQKQVTVGFNDSARPYNQNLCLHELFEAQVERTPEKTAVVFGDQTLSYAALNQRANQVAHRLSHLGVAPGMFVGVAMERSLEMVIALYGVLKAGVAYVPLDPSYPADRLAFMLDDAAVPVLLTQPHLAGQFTDVDAQVICVDESLYTESSENFDSQATAQDLAYMIYTSGSTGKPKGALNSHAGIVNRLLWMQERYLLKDDDRILQKTPFSFDVSVWEFFWPLLNGATLVVVRPEGHKDGRYLTQLIQAENITTIHFVPSMLALFLEESNLEQTTGSLRRVICSGEALPYSLQERFFQRISADLHNLYGPTEAAVDVTYWQCAPSTTDRTVPIGRPVANTEIFIVDQFDQPTPIGVPGELLIGGAQVGRGYWKRPELTAEKFHLFEYGTHDKMRVYRTGDLARWRTDGTLEYLGRIDSQIKLRGFRVELGEIEAALLSQATVREATVILRNDLASGSQLVAYVTAEGPLDYELTRSRLKESLPEYMLPAFFMQLETMPLSHNGKVERRQLPVPNVALVVENRPGRNPLENGLVEIWAELLQLPEVGITDNFFDLGGHSLLAMQMVSRIEATLGHTVPVRLVFEHPQIAQLAQAIVAVQDSGVQRPLVRPMAPIDVVSRLDPLPLSNAQQRLWILNQMDGQTATYNIASALQITGNLDVGLLQKSLELLVARHEILRTSFGFEDGRAVQKIHDSKNAVIKIKTVDLADVTDRLDGLADQIEKLAAEEGKRPFDLSQLPLMRLTLLQTSESSVILLLTMHHIITDGWSLTVFVRELSHFYASLSGGKSHLSNLKLPALKALNIQYADYAAWQSKHLTDDKLAPQIDYWRNQLVDLPPLLNLPTDRARPAIQTSNGRIHYFAFEAELTAALKQMAREHDVTLFMLLLAGFSTLLSRYSNQNDISVGSGIANRTRPEIESLIGFFVNTLVMRVDTAGNPPFEKLLKRVREMALDAYAHQDVPFERLVEILQPVRDMSHTPLFQVIFTLQNMPEAKASLPELEIEPWHVKESPAKLDLTVLMTEADGVLTGTLEYNSDLFDDSTIERLVSQFEILLRSAVADPSRPILTLELLTKNEHKLLAAWNDTAAHYPESATIASLFEEMAERFGGQTAVIGTDQTLTYKELSQQAQHIAMHLVAQGVEPGDRVGLYLGRSPKIIVAMLGTLYAGGVYVPLDPDYPADRISLIALHSGCRLVVYDDVAPVNLPCESLRFYDLMFQTAADSGVAPQGATADDPAYLLYTSGSTGRPKGVLVTHRNVVRLIKNDANLFDFTERDVWVTAHSFSFDFSVWEMYGALLNGGSVVIVERETARDPRAFLALLQQHRVTVLNQTPAAFYNLLDYEKMSGTATLHHHLHTVVFGGDRLDPTYLRPWVSRYRLDQIRLVNMYGITETTVHVTHHTLTERDVWGDSGRSVIGVPIPETQVYILNEAMQEQPVGVPGEIYVGGSGVSAGYWGQPELTAERFVEPVTGMRIYKSGDLGRWLPDGSLEHLGRNDFQVQLRGFRVELGEIEQVILANPLVSKVTVIAQGDGADGRIVAYVIPDENVAPAVNAFATLQQTGELDGRTLTQLPNQQMIAHLNQNETDFVYNEIFVDHCYLQHGIVIKAGDTVVDVGANIGMFSLFAAQQAADVTIHAFEPLPTAFACLQLNGRLHNLNLKAHQMGISDQMGKTSFDFYPHVSILSGQFTGADDEREIVRETVRQFLNQQGESEFIEELLDQRLQYETITAELTTLSHMIEQEKIEQIDLLKVDVEKGERAVLNSIDGADWLKIKQVVMELHDVDGTLAWVIDFLEEKGFSVATAQDETLTTTHLYNLYATRAAGIDLPVQSNVVHENLNPNLFIEQLRAGIGLALPDYMVPANFVLLGHFPLTRNGKIDRKALPLPEQAHLQVEVILPRTTVESEMVAIWQEVLGVDMIGITDNFFTLGGHSLLATQLMVRIPAVFGVELPLSAIFESPTVAELAERVETLRWAAGLTEKDKEGGVTESVREEGRL